MKKKLKKFLLAVLAVLSISSVSIVCASCADSCGGTSVESSSSVGGEETPAGVTLGKDGTLTWPEVAGATYKISVDGTNYVDAASNSVSVFDYVKSTSVTKVYVKATKDGKDTAVGDIAVEVVQLATPAKPEIVFNEEMKTQQFVWNEVENVKQYSISVNDGKWTKYLNPYWTPGSTGAYTIKVKCIEYVKVSSSKNQIFLASGESEVSDTLNFIEGPVLSLDRIHVVSWAATEEFDSYNIWIDGVKVRENVESPLNLVTGDDPVITKTGEYDIQIEAIKGEQSVYSNVLEETGTMNINEGEIYSFDNRVYRLTAAKEGVEISDEQFHGESGYSLKLTNPGQLNLVKYVDDGINDIDFRTITKLSYWIYVPDTIEGYPYDYITNRQIPAIKYDATNSHTFANEEIIPLGEWTKVTFDVTVQHEQVLILSFHYGYAAFWPDEVAFPMPSFYIDDISYEAIDIPPEGTEYSGRATGYFGVNTAAKVLTGLTPDTLYRIRLQYQTNIDGKATELGLRNTDKLNITWFSNATTLADPATYGWGNPYDISTSGWKTLELNVMSNSVGDVYIGSATAGGDIRPLNEEEEIVLEPYPGGLKQFIYYFKDVAVVEQIQLPQTPEDAEFTGTSSGYFATNAAGAKVLTGLEANTEYTISFKYQTSIDGKATELNLVNTDKLGFIWLTSATTYDNSALWGSPYTIDTTGWKDIIGMKVMSDANGDVWIGSATAGGDIRNGNVTPYPGYLTTFSYYIKDVQMASAWNVTKATGDGYTITGADSVVDGQDYTFTVAVADSHNQSTPVVKVNGEVVTAVEGVYTVANVQADLSITVESVAINTYTVTLNNGTEYTLAGADSVTHGSNYTFTLTLASGYETAAVVVTVNGGVVEGENGSYTVENVAEALTIEAQVDRITYTVNFDAKGGTPVASATVYEGQDLTSVDTVYATTKGIAVFQGWYTADNQRVGEGALATMPNIGAEGTEITVYAKWDNDFTAMFSSTEAWTVNKTEKIYVGTDYAEKQVMLLIDVCGDLDATNETGVATFWSFAENTTDVNNNKGSSYIAHNAISSTTTWSKTIIDVYVDADGYAWLGFATWFEKSTTESTNVYVKDVQVIGEYGAKIARPVYTSQQNGWFNKNGTKISLGAEHASKTLQFTATMYSTYVGTPGAGLIFTQATSATFVANNWLYYSYQGSDMNAWLYADSIVPSATGTEMKFTVTTDANGDAWVWLGLNPANCTNQNVTIYFANIVAAEIEEPEIPEGTEFTGNSSGYFAVNNGAKVLTGLDANTEYKITFQYQTNIDGKATELGLVNTDKLGFIWLTSATTYDNSALWGTTYDVSTTGWKTMTEMTVMSDANGDVWIGSATAGGDIRNGNVTPYPDGSATFNYYIKSVSVVTA